MSRVGKYALVFGMVMGVSGSGWAAEHGGQEHEHGGQEHGGQSSVAAPVVTVEPSAEQIRQTIRGYISEVQQEEGAFTIEDEVTGKTRTLTLDQVHERVGKTGEYYYSCTDMKDQETGDMLDLDFDVESYEGDLEIVDVRIHKMNGQPRYTYDNQDNRVPVTPAVSGDAS